MNSPVEERKWDQVTILISSSVDDVSRKGCLAADVIEQVAFFFFFFLLPKLRNLIFHLRLIPFLLKKKII